MQHQTDKIIFKKWADNVWESEINTGINDAVEDPSILIKNTHARTHTTHTQNRCCCVEKVKRKSFQKSQSKQPHDIVGHDGWLFLLVSIDDGNASNFVTLMWPQFFLVWLLGTKTSSVPCIYSGRRKFVLLKPGKKRIPFQVRDLMKGSVTSVGLWRKTVWRQLWGTGNVNEGRCLKVMKCTEGTD